MKLTFTTSLALLTAASASSANGGGLRSRRLSLFAEDSSAKKKGKNASTARASTSNAKADKSDDDADDSTPLKTISNAKADKSDDDADDSTPLKTISNAKADKSNSDDSTSPRTTDPGSKSAKVETKSNVIGGAKAAKAAEAANLKMESARPYNGLETEEDLYYFGDKIEGSFELDDETLSDAAAANFNATLISDYKIGMFPFMGRPNCDGNPAIVEVPVTTVVADANATDFEGTFSIDTSIALSKEGTGFDLYLMDEDGCNEILGPLAVTITLTPEEQKAEDEAAELKSKSANTPRAKAEKGKAATVKKTTYKKKKKEVDPEKITVKSKEALSTEDYELATDKVEYEVDEDIVVNYSIVAAPTATAEGRRLKKKNKKNKKNKDQPESEPITDEPEDEPVDEPMEEQVDEPVSDQPEPELQPDPVVSEDDEDEEGEQQPDLLPTDLAIEEATVSDPTDITKFKLGVFMKMANPQHGKLLALHEVPLCTSGSCTAEEISAGTITISAADIDTSRYGSGYDIWILDDSGDGIAGPVFFAIDA